MAAHPIGALWRAGLSLSCHTDNPLMSCTSMSQEVALLVAHQGLAPTGLLTMVAEAARRSFLPEADRAVALAAAQARATAWAT